MGNAWKLILRFGPLVAAFFLGISAIVEQFVPGYTGIVTSIFSTLGVVGVEADQELLAEINTFAAGVMVLVGVVRKVISLVQEKAKPPQA